MDTSTPYSGIFESTEQKGLYELAAAGAYAADIARELLTLLGDLDAAHCFRDSSRRDEILARKLELTAKLDELGNRAA